MLAHDKQLLVPIVSCASGAEDAKSGKIGLWSIGDATVSQPIEGAPVAHLAVSRDFALAASVTFSDESRDNAQYFPARLSIWDLTAHAQRFTSTFTIANQDGGYAATFRQLAVIGNNVVVLFEASSLAPDNHGYTGPDEYRIAVWNLVDGKLLATTGARLVADSVDEVDAHLNGSSDGTRVYVTTPGGIDVWRLPQ